MACVLICYGEREMVGFWTTKTFDQSMHRLQTEEGRLGESFAARERWCFLRYLPDSVLGMGYAHG